MGPSPLSFSSFIRSNTTFLSSSFIRSKFVSSFFFEQTLSLFFFLKYSNKKMNLQWSRLVFLYVGRFTFLCTCEYHYISVHMDIVVCTGSYTTKLNIYMSTYQQEYIYLHYLLCTYTRVYTCKKNLGCSYVHKCWCTSNHSFVKTPKLATSFDLFLHSPLPLQFAPSL